MSKYTDPSFIMYTIGLLIVWLLVIAMAEIPPANTAGSMAVAGAAATPTAIYRANSNPPLERQHERNCKALCEHCGCMGFYCGEECICECNNKNSDTLCIAAMQNNARKLKIPFEILLQGPTSSDFMHNALQYELNPERKRCRAEASAKGQAQNKAKRATVTIYKPSLAYKTSTGATANSLDSTIVKKDEIAMARHKRSFGDLNWFNDLANNLVSPAPLRLRKLKEPEQEPMQQKREVPKFDPTWLIDQSIQKLTRPAPLFNRRHSRAEDLSDMEPMAPVPAPAPVAPPAPASATNGKKMKSKVIDTNEQRPAVKAFQSALEAVEQFPRVLKDTMHGLAGDNNIGDTIYNINFLNPADMLPKKIPTDQYAGTYRKLSEDSIQRPINFGSSLDIEPPQERLLTLPWLSNRRGLLKKRWNERFGNKNE